MKIAVWKHLILNNTYCTQIWDSYNTHLIIEYNTKQFELNILLTSIMALIHEFR
jgi:hypothetical protein